MVSVFVGGRPAKLAVLPVHGSAATSTGGFRSIPFGIPLRKRSNHWTHSSR